LREGEFGDEEGEHKGQYSNMGKENREQECEDGREGGEYEIMRSRSLE
jgi:hypothetical protein